MHIGCCKEDLDLLYLTYKRVGRNSSVGIATALRAGRSGDRIPLGARFSSPVQTGYEVHPASCTMGTGSFPEATEWPGRDADPSPTSSAVIKKE
jgi:hypothetical protein